MMSAFPHLTDTESVRREAAEQHGGLSDAAAFLAAHRANRDPDVEAAALRHRNAEATAEVQDDLSLAQEKIDAVHGEGKYRVIDAAVRGNALSTVCEDQYGRPQHVTVGWNDAWRSIVPKGPEAEARANAQAEAARGRLGAEARAEVKRLVDEATAGILSRVSELLGTKQEEVTRIRDDAVAEALDEEATQERRAAENAGQPVVDEGGDEDDEGEPSSGSPSSTEGNDTSESEAGATQGSETEQKAAPKRSSAKRSSAKRGSVKRGSGGKR